MKHGQGLRQGDQLSPLIICHCHGPPSMRVGVGYSAGRLHLLHGRPAQFDTSMLADDMAIFVSPIKENIDGLTKIFNSFGEATGLLTNSQKNLVAPIRCHGLSLDDILQSMSVVVTTFYMKYLGLPHSIKRLKHIHFQGLEDKTSGKLKPCYARHFNMAGWRILCNR